MKNLFLTKTRWLVTIILLTALGSGNAWADTYSKATSISAGDVVLLVCERATKELSGISTTSTKYGLGTTYTTTPAGTYELTVCDGSSTGTFAFKNSSDNYLYWGSGNSLNVNSTLNSNTSWSVSFDGSGNATIENSSTSGRIIMWNSGSPRFATYSGQSFGNSYYYVQIYKKASSCANKVTLTKGSTTNGTFDLDKANGEHDNCDANFVVHVSNIVPADGSKYCNGIDATGGNSTVTGPVDGVWTVTYTKGNSITSTITPTYATKTLYTVTWFVEGTALTGLASGLTSVYSGDKVTGVPSTSSSDSSCEGEFVGWVKSDNEVVDQKYSDNYMTVPTVFTDAAGSPTITGNTAFHAVFKKRKAD